MRLHNLKGRTKNGYTTWGCIWDPGTCTERTEFRLQNTDTEETIPMQSRVTAYWPDGSVKWTAHTADAGQLRAEIEVMRVPAGAIGGRKRQIVIIEKDFKKIIDAGKLRIIIPSDGACLFEAVSWEGRPVLYRARPVLILEEPSESAGNKTRTEKEYEACIEQVEIEEAGNLQVIVKYSGCHKKGGETKIPFIIRLKARLDGKKLDIVHTFVYDGDEEKDYLKGLGIKMEAPLAGPVYNRHVKFTGDYGVFHESMAQLLSWRPKVPDHIYRKQMNGECLMLEGSEREVVETVLKDMPFWSEYELCQDSANHFAIRKKINAANCCYLDCLSGQRTNGIAAFGSESGSILLAIRDFWENILPATLFVIWTGIWLRQRSGFGHRGQKPWISGTMPTGGIIRCITRATITKGQLRMELPVPVKAPFSSAMRSFLLIQSCRNLPELSDIRLNMWERRSFIMIKKPLATGRCQRWKRKQRCGWKRSLPRLLISIGKRFGSVVGMGCLITGILCILMTMSGISGDTIWADMHGIIRNWCRRCGCGITLCGPAERMCLPLQKSCPGILRK